MTGTIPASGNWQSGLLPSDGYKVIAAGCTSTQAGTLSIQRYLDTAGLIPQGAPVSAAIVANTPVVVNATDGKPFAAFQVTVQNTGASPATISAFTILMAAA